ncbi:hypothetical protein CS5676_0041 [Clostridium phage phiCs5676-1]|nr:hypothetical protein CS5676_0041 [Clostridium phage phiCs5676-1]
MSGVRIPARSWNESGVILVFTGVAPFLYIFLLCCMSACGDELNVYFLSICPFFVHASTMKIRSS